MRMLSAKLCSFTFTFTKSLKIGHPSGTLSDSWEGETDSNTFWNICLKTNYHQNMAVPCKETAVLCITSLVTIIVHATGGPEA